MTRDKFLDYLSRIAYLSFNIDDSKAHEINQIAWVLYNEIIKETEEVNQENK